MNKILEYLIRTLTDRNTIAVAIAWLVGYAGLTLTEIQIGQLVELALQIISVALVFIPAKYVPLLGRPKA
jgi:hypothetical protein